MRNLCLTITFTVLLVPPFAEAEDRVFPNGAALEELWNQGEFTEGVAVRSDGQVFFSDIARDPEVKGRILQFDPRTKTTSVFIADSKKSNGLYFDANGKLHVCCGANGGAMALCIVTKQNKIKPLIKRFEGKRFNSPNDLVIHPDGSIYFSDPRYVGPERIELDHQSVFRYVPDTGKVQRVTMDIEKPNGLNVSPDGRTLYVAETNNGSTGQDPEAKPKQGRMTLNAFEITETGALQNKRVLVDFGDQLGIDGMAVAQNGNIFAAVRSQKRFGIVVYSPDGEELNYMKTPALPTNCCFGTGNAASTLYVTAGGGLYCVQLTN